MLELTLVVTWHILQSLQESDAQALGKAKSCLAKLRNKRYLPRSFKVTMARSAGLGKALYGAELVHTTNLQWKELRGPIGRSMGYVGSGGSTLLALAVFDPDLDPQFANLVRTLRFWRRFMRIFPRYAYKLS